MFKLYYPLQVPDVDAIVIPVGGGGLIAGVALAVKTMKPDVLIIGVEPEVTSRHQGHSSGHRVTLSPLQACPSFKTALEVGRAVQVPTQASLADGNITQYTPMEMKLMSLSRPDRAHGGGERPGHGRAPD